MPKQSNLNLVPEKFTYEREQIEGSNYAYIALGDGHRYYLKIPSIDTTEPLPNDNNQFRSYCEVVATKLAQCVLIRSERISTDILVPESRLIRIPHEQGMIYGVASEFIPELKQNQPTLSNHHRALIFTLSAWLNDWDRPSKLYINVDNRIVLIGFGGALDCRLSPKPGEFITKTAHYGSEAFSTKTDAFETMRDSNRNYLGYLFTQGLTDNDFQTVAQYIVDLTDAEIERCVRAVFENADFNVVLNPVELINTLIRRKYDLAYRLGVVPKEFNYATFPTIANFILKTYYYHSAENDTGYKELYAEWYREINPNAVQRIEHGMEHAARTAIYIDILIEFLRKRDYLPAVNLTPEMIQALKITALFHDAGRTCDVGGENAESEQRSVEYCYQFLLETGTEPSLAQRISDLIQNKENYKDCIPRDDLSVEDLCGVLLHQADVIEVMRSHSWEFDPQYLRFLNQFVRKTPIVQLKDSSTGKPIEKYTGEIELSKLLDEIKAILKEMGDCPKEESFSLAKKEEIRASRHPYQMIGRHFSTDSICQRYLKNGVTLFTPQKTEQPMEDQHDQSQTVRMTTDVNVPQIGLSEESENLPYGEYYTHEKLKKDGRQRHQKKLLLVKISHVPPETIRQCGGFHPNCIMPDLTLTLSNTHSSDPNIKQSTHPCIDSLRNDCLDVPNHRTSPEDSGVVSITQSLKVAKEAAFYNKPIKEAYIYLLIAPPGSISDAPTAEQSYELEYIILGGLDFSDIIGWRKIVTGQDHKSFQDNLYLTDAFLTKYPIDFIRQASEFLLNPDETLPTIQLIRTNNPQEAFEAFRHHPSSPNLINYMMTRDEIALLDYCKEGNDISAMVPIAFQMKETNYLKILSLFKGRKER